MSTSGSIYEWSRPEHFKPEAKRSHSYPAGYQKERRLLFFGLRKAPSQRAYQNESLPMTYLTQISSESSPWLDEKVKIIPLLVVYREGPRQERIQAFASKHNKLARLN